MAPEPRPAARGHLGPGLERQLHAEDLGVAVPVHEEGVAALDLGIGDFKRDRLVGLRREKDVLPRAVGGLLPLLEARHEPVARRAGAPVGPARDLGVLDLEEQRALVFVGVELLRDSVPGPPDLDAAPLDRHRGARRDDLLARAPRLPRGPLGEVALVPAPLRVREVAPFALVHRQAQAALVLPQVVSHEVGVLGDVYGLEGEAAEALTAVDVLCWLFFWRGWGDGLDGEREKVVNEGRGRRLRSRLGNDGKRIVTARRRRWWRCRNKPLSLTSCAADVCPPVPGLEPCSLAAMKDISRRSEAAQREKDADGSFFLFRRRLWSFASSLVSSLSLFSLSQG